jgi:hypothetical protein
MLLNMFKYIFDYNEVIKYKTNNDCDEYDVYQELEKTSNTDNNAKALLSTDNIFLDLFVNLNRDLDNYKLEDYIKDCIKIDPLKTIAIIYNCRDRKNGKKEKKISNDAMYILKSYDMELYKKNIYNYIDKYGCWKDLLYIAEKDVKFLYVETRLFAKKLVEDKNKLENNDDNISLCAKWSPSENKNHDKKLYISKEIALDILYLEYNIHKKISLEDYNKYKEKSGEYYRKQYLSPLRNKINIIEKLLCNKEYNKINYESVPSIAHKRLKNTFMKHDMERYNNYLKNLQKGIAKINTTGILPHELVNYYLTDNKELDLTIESQWKTIVKDIKKSGILDNILAVVDVSGSMFSASNGSIPAQVSIALGLLISECSTNLFKNKVITFTECAEFHNIEGETLKERINSIKNMNWGYSTNFESVAEIIVDFGKKYRILDKDMPKKIIVLSDMQFDEAQNIDKNNKLPHNIFLDKFKKNNFTSPKIIYWNLNSDNTKSFPVDINENGTAIISGFSEQLLKIFMEYDNFDPNIVLNKILEPYIKYININKGINID